MLFNCMTSRKNSSASSNACTQNVGQFERMISAALGGSLLIYGLRRRGWFPALLGSSLLYRGASGHCELYHRAGISTADDKPFPQTSVPHHQGVKVVSAVTINRPAAELYRYWRDLKNLPNFMSRIERLEVQNGHSRWTYRSVAGKTFSWEAEIINDLPDQLLAWRSLDGADIDHAGSVRFDPAPGARGTQVRVTMEYRPPAGKLGAAAARLLGTEPKQLLDEDLRRFKQLMEAGELASVEGQPQAS